MIALKAPVLTLRKVLTYWLVLILTVILASVALIVYLMVYARVDEATLNGLSFEVQHNWQPDAQPHHRRHSHHWGPRPDFPEHDDHEDRGPMMGTHGPHGFPGGPHMPHREPLHLTLNPNTTPDLTSLANPFIIARYYNLEGKCLQEAGGNSLPGAPPGNPAKVLEMIQSGLTNSTYSQYSDYERWLLWDIQVTDKDGKPVGVLEVGKGSKPLDDLLKNLAASLVIVAGLGVALGALLAGPLAKRLAQPIEDMAGVARQVSEGDFRVRVIPAGTTEVKAMAEDFNHMIDQLGSIFETQKRFVADASHELKTPLTTVAAMAELLHDQENLLTPKRRLRALSLIQSEVQRMNRLVVDLLTLSKIEQAPLQQCDLNIAESLEDIVSDYQLTHPNLEISRPADFEPHLFVDKEGWDRTVRNLIDNALTHTPPEGKVQVRLNARNRQILLEIADQGSGIPEADLPKVTQRFYRSDLSRSRHTGGTGLGLSLVSAWVEHCGGRLEIKSILGEGTVVSIWLPC